MSASVDAPSGHYLQDLKRKALKGWGGERSMCDAIDREMAKYYSNLFGGFLFKKEKKCVCTHEKNETVNIFDTQRKSFSHGGLVNYRKRSNNTRP